jgi:DNA-binding response OmpR family regulator
MIKRVKSRHPEIPIIAVSAGDEESGRRALQLGADIFLYKPLVLSKLFSTVCSLLRLGDEKKKG